MPQLDGSGVRGPVAPEVNELALRKFKCRPALCSPLGRDAVRLLENADTTRPIAAELQHGVVCKAYIKLPSQRVETVVQRRRKQNEKKRRVRGTLDGA